jgi:predicted methyltransferase
VDDDESVTGHYADDGQPPRVRYARGARLGLAAGALLGLGCSRAPTAPSSTESKASLAATSAQAPESEARPQVDRYRRPDVVMAALALRPGMVVADVGAGAGYFTLRIARAVGAEGHVVATEINRGALGELERRARGAGLAQVETRVVEPAVPGLEAGRYDLIFLAEVDQLLADRTAFFAALLPALKPGGRLVVENRVRYRDGLLSSLASLPLRADPDPAHTAAPPEQYVRSWLRADGTNP